MNLASAICLGCTGVNHTSEGFLIAELVVLIVAALASLVLDDPQFKGLVAPVITLAFVVLFYAGYYGIAIAKDLTDEVGAGIATISACLFATNFHLLFVDH